MLHDCTRRCCPTSSVCGGRAPNLPLILQMSGVKCVLPPIAVICSARPGGPEPLGREYPWGFAHSEGEHSEHSELAYLRQFLLIDGCVPIPVCLSAHCELERICYQPAMARGNLWVAAREEGSTWLFSATHIEHARTCLPFGFTSALTIHIDANRLIQLKEITKQNSKLFSSHKAQSRQGDGAMLWKLLPAILAALWLPQVRPSCPFLVHCMHLAREMRTITCPHSLALGRSKSHLSAPSRSCRCSFQDGSWESLTRVTPTGVPALLHQSRQRLTILKSHQSLSHHPLVEATSFQISSLAYDSMASTDDAFLLAR